MAHAETEHLALSESAQTHPIATKARGGLAICGKLTHAATATMNWERSGVRPTLQVRGPPGGTLQLRQRNDVAFGLTAKRIQYTSVRDV